MYGDGIDKAMTFIMILCGLAGAGLMVGAFIVVPWLWGVIKPWLHAVTG